MCSTVDRYNDDVHFMGGCLLSDNMDWGGAFFSVANVPPDPQMVGPGWKEQWLKRLEIAEAFPAKWLQHQRRDAFWQHGSVCEDYGKLKAAILAVGGWADGYTAAVFRLVENLNRPDCKGIAGPWGHLDPYRGIPGPPIGFLQECKRWWDRWLKGIDTGVEKDPALRLWLQTMCRRNRTTMCGQGADRAGKGLAGSSGRIGRSMRMAFAEGGTRRRSRSSPQTTGTAGGEWCPYGLGKVAPEMPLDQRIDDAGSLVFDSAPLEKHALLVGDPVARLELSVDKPLAFVAVRLSDVAPDGQVTKVTYGLQNLAQRASQSEPSKLVPGQRYQIRVRLNEIAHQFEPGHRIRISVSTSYFPLVWPSPEPVTLTLQAGESSIELPYLRKDALKVVDPFEPAEQARPRPSTVLAPGHDIADSPDVATAATVRISRDDGWPHRGYRHRGRLTRRQE
jgi:putative CocE/NonD family hydrolase